MMGCLVPQKERGKQRSEEKRSNAGYVGSRNHATIKRKT